MKVIESPKPGSFGYQCNGKCGDGEVCSMITYTNGYCLDPEARDKAVKEYKEKIYGKQQT